VPRIAATLGSLLLIACSIGVNAVRYPAVSQMVGAAYDAGGNDATPTPGPAVVTAVTAAKPVADTPLPLKVRELPPPSMTGETAAVADPTEAGPVQKPLVEPVGHIREVRPLPTASDPPPLDSASSSNPSADDAQTELRRLPPVESDRGATASMISPPPSVVRSYPSTGVN
jgi:hypothetical protein